MVASTTAEESLRRSNRMETDPFEENDQDRQRGKSHDDRPGWKKTFMSLGCIAMKTNNNNNSPDDPLHQQHQKSQKEKKKKRSFWGRNNTEDAGSSQWDFSFHAARPLQLSTVEEEKYGQFSTDENSQLGSRSVVSQVEHPLPSTAEETETN
uniref:Uncharacterized protein n=1 Tax=Entomoneis paludosa TaxID=265537 RepID=A0A7S3DRD0_9STRA|mmetsp:Transcript_29370/g.61450  ORF Transcript_29370/g.61450 Transcript_29370/m.61450 type:complete len:152 (+) Transcript_29370:91-546(+)